MENSPSWEIDSHSVVQEILSLLCNPKICYRFQETSPLDHVLNMLNRVYNLNLCSSTNFVNISHFLHAYCLLHPGFAIVIIFGYE